MSSNLADQLGQTCTKTWQGYESEVTPAGQIARAKETVVGEGWINLGPAKLNFPILCLKNVLVVHPSYVESVLYRLERWVFQPVPWAKRVGGGFAWCGMSYACDPGNGVCATPQHPVNQLYSTGIHQPGPCLSQYDYTQRDSSGRSNTQCWNESQQQWKTFWLGVGDAVRRFNAGEPPVR